MTTKQKVAIAVLSIAATYGTYRFLDDMVARMRSRKIKNDAFEGAKK